MKKMLLWMVVAMVFGACTKTSSPDTTDRPAAVLNSVSVYFPLTQSRVTEVFGFDKSNQLATIRLHDYDSLSDPGIPFVDSFLVNFSVSSTDIPPASYSVNSYYHGDGPMGESEQHVLSYDDQHRVVLDSITTNTAAFFTSRHFLYDDLGNTIIQTSNGDPMTPGSFVLDQIDTLFIQNENILSDLNHGYVYGISDYSFLRTYSTHENPLYQAEWAKSLGCLLVASHYLDFRSVNLPSAYVHQQDSDASYTLNYLWTNDVTGHVTGGTGRNAGDNNIQEVYSYVYLTD